MNTSKTALVIFVLVALTMACQVFSQGGLPVSEPTKDDFVTPEGDVENEFVITEETESYGETHFVDPGVPGDYKDICGYGPALIPYPPLIIDREFVGYGSSPMKPNSYGMTDTWCIAEASNTADHPFYTKSFETTLGLDEIFVFYRDHFYKAGYIEEGPVRDAQPGRPGFKYMTWSGYDGYTITVYVTDEELSDPNNPAYKGLFYVSFEMRDRSK